MSDESSPETRIATGRIRGVARPGHQFFTGIPYAAAPTGPGRFASPAPVAPWDGVRDATRPGPTSPAPQRGGFGGMDLRPVLGDGWARGEDYLTVTVTTPDVAARGLPVLVFVHGGGFVSGTGQAELHDGAAFARDGVVLVTLNYRLGVAGWLDIPGAPANRGLLDVIAALTWVAENIHAFGGDPDRVTVAGQSAGAMIVAALLAAPQADGLFHRAISQSGSGLCAFAPEQASWVTRSVCGALGVPATAEALSATDDDRLVAVLAEVPPVDHAAHGHRDTSLGNGLFKPVIDGVLLDQQPALVLERVTKAGATSRGPVAKDLLIGTNSEEANLYFVPNGSGRELTKADLLAAAARRHAEPEALVARYHARFPDASAATLAARLITDVYAESSRALADAHAGRPGSRTYAYEFGWRSTAFDDALGACHCVELPFVFDRTEIAALHGEHALLGPDRPAHSIASRMHASWVSFVEHGDPGWEPYNSRSRATMHIDEEWQLAHEADHTAAR
ncbi:carboxylesterase/lipase family protein [Streptomyces sp. NPDC101225]|uniref:carboxylesterase/lipase family protein n=1 Tax=Streptomyces sp. NPDC101225 TaxID=3366135 RepID=UPI00382C4191